MPLFNRRLANPKNIRLIYGVGYHPNLLDGLRPVGLLKTPAMLFESNNLTLKDEVSLLFCPISVRRNRIKCLAIKRIDCVKVFALSGRTSVEAFHRKRFAPEQKKDDS